MLGSKGGAGPLPKTTGPGRTADPNSHSLAGREPVSATGPFPAPPLLELGRSQSPPRAAPGPGKGRRKVCECPEGGSLCPAKVLPQRAEASPFPTLQRGGVSRADTGLMPGARDEGLPPAGAHPTTTP